MSPAPPPIGSYPLLLRLLTGCVREEGEKQDTRVSVRRDGKDPVEKFSDSLALFLLPSPASSSQLTTVKQDDDSPLCFPRERR